MHNSSTHFLSGQQGEKRGVYLDNRHSRSGARALVLSLPSNPSLQLHQLSTQRPHLQPCFLVIHHVLMHRPYIAVTHQTHVVPVGLLYGNVTFCVLTHYDVVLTNLHQAYVFISIHQLHMVLKPPMPSATAMYLAPSKPHKHYAETPASAIYGGDALGMC